MKSCFLDTNIFIRYLTNDDPAKAERVDKLLAEAADGKIKLVTVELVLAEVVWVLESSYGLKNSSIGPMIKAILATPGLEVINGPLVEKAVEHYMADNIDFIDGYIAAVMERHKISEIFSYDKKHLTRIAAIRRNEP
ncbi:MAG: type II toxin-antitoxin system VapC family toxin [Desulfobacterales bacterium]|nr:type II toxin-antitoxin system VapC family toxin [Desulfobacterales bacterium]